MSITNSVDTAINLLKDVVTSRNPSIKSHSHDSHPDPLEAETSLKWATGEIQANKGFSQEDLADATEVMLNKPSVTNMYLLIKEEGTCRVFLLN
jgi:hypothetical protein